MEKLKEMADKFELPEALQSLKDGIIEQFNDISYPSDSDNANEDSSDHSDTQNSPQKQSINQKQQIQNLILQRQSLQNQELAQKQPSSSKKGIFQGIKNMFVKQPKPEMAVKSFQSQQSNVIQQKQDQFIFQTENEQTIQQNIELDQNFVIVGEFDKLLEMQIPKHKNLPKNFANKVLDLELKIDSGRFDLECIDKLMQLYSQAVEYYSGMNDEKYMYFTERIQNTLLKTEVLKLMQNANSMDQQKKKDFQKQFQEQKEKEKAMTHEELMRIKQLEHEERKKQKLELLHDNKTNQVFLDPEFIKDNQIIMQEKEKTVKTMQTLKNDIISQKDSIQQRIAERKIKKQNKKSSIIQNEKETNSDKKVQQKLEFRQNNNIPPFTGRNDSELRHQFNKENENEEPEHDIENIDINYVDNHNMIVVNQNFSQNSPKKQGQSQNKTNLAQNLNETSSINNYSNYLDSSTNLTQNDYIQNFQSSQDFENNQENNQANQREKSYYSGESSVQHFKIENFDAQSTISHFFNQEEFQQYEEHIQEKINEVWDLNQQKLDKLQNDFQTELEKIIEDQAQIKFEKIAEVKLMYKNCDDSQNAQRDLEIEQIKSDMEANKAQRVLEAKEKMQQTKKKYQQEKQQLLQEVKKQLTQNRPNLCQGERSQIGENYDYMNSSPAKIKKSPNHNFSLNKEIISNSPKKSSGSFIKLNETEDFGKIAARQHQSVLEGYNSIKIDKQQTEEIEEYKEVDVEIDLIDDIEIN